MVDDLLRKAYQYCVKKGYQFTAPRERVLKILLTERKPMGAYDIVQRLTNEMGKHNPPTVYRAIQFWRQEGFIHCIESLKSYVACSEGQHTGQSQFLVCSQCDFVKELDSAIDFSSTTQNALAMQFNIMSIMVELKGLCAHCQHV